MRTLINTQSGKSQGDTVTYTDNPPTGTSYFYQMELVDSEGNPVTVESNMAPVAGFTAVGGSATLILFMTAPLSGV